MDGASDLKIRILPPRARPDYRAIASLIGQNNTAVENGSEDGNTVTIQSLSLAAISPNRYQQREFSEDGAELQELVNSIKSRGILQPVTVRPLPEALPEKAEYELIAGERRVRAARLAGLFNVPAIVREVSNQELLEYAIIENAQRTDLNPIAEASAFKLLIEEFGLNQSDVSQIVGKNRVTITNSLRLLQLDEGVRDLVESGTLSAGHGRALLRIDSSRLQLRLAHRAVKKNLSVRALELLVERIQNRTERKKSKTQAKGETDQLERKVRRLLALDTIHVSRDTQGRKRLTITFPSDTAWNSFLSKFKSRSR